MLQFVCAGGSGSRMKMYAEMFAEDTGLKILGNLSKSDRYAMYKTGQVLWVNVSFFFIGSLTVLLLR